MKIGTKFNFRDKVWKIEHQHDQTWMPCSFCGGTGRVKGQNSQIRACPDCCGRGGRNASLPRKWQITRELEIGKIDVEWTCENKDLDSQFDNYSKQAESYKERYMCYETGIGTGTCHKAEDLFRSKEAAQAECDRRNKP